MARSIAQIRKSVVGSLVSAAAAIGITIDPDKWIKVPGDLSQTDQKALLLDTVVDAQSFEEQLNDAFIVDIETIIKISATQTAPWFKNRALNVFQFNSSTPQVPKIIPRTVTIDGVPYPITTVLFSPVVDAYKVIKYCNVLFVSSGRVLIKVAGQVGGLPVDLDTAAGAGALAAYQSFVNADAAPGISYTALSGNSDKLFTQIDVYYNGSYSAVIFDNIKAAMTKYLNDLSSLDFDGKFRLSDYYASIKSVEGVIDYFPVNISARADSTPFGGGTDLVLGSDELQLDWQTVAGYIEHETTAGKTLSDYRVGSSGALNLNCIPV